MTEQANSQLPLAEPLTPEAPPSSPPKERHLLRWFTLFLIILAVAWFCLWFFYLRYYESTDDAYANGNMVTINAAVSGSVIAFYADDTDYVQEGQLLVTLDPTYYKIAFDKSLASLAATILHVKQLRDQVQVKQALLENKTVALSKARFDYQNRSLLVSSLAVSNEDFIHSRDDLMIAELNVRQAEYELKEASDAAGNMPIEGHPLVEEQKNGIREAFYRLKHCHIYAPTSGYIAQRSVEVGEWASVDTPLMAIIPDTYIWVDANFKETQLTYMRVGQPAVVWFDLYGSDVKFEGKVLGIASGTGSVFSLIPPQNATGNWIKIVQRLPVRISLDPDKLKEYPIRLGISAEVDVDITQTDLPIMSQPKPVKAIGATHVFDIDLSEVDALITEVINANINVDAGNPT